jgi:hypothetical protein
MKASTILCRRIGGALWPDDPKSAEAIRSIPRHTSVPVRLLRERNHEQLALYWRVLERLVEATDRWRCAEELHLALKIATGRIGEVTLLTGRRVLVPESVAFDQMSQDEFTRYFDAAMRVLCEEVMGNCSIEELLDQTIDRRRAA